MYTLWLKPILKKCSVNNPLTLVSCDVVNYSLSRVDAAQYINVLRVLN